LRGCRVQASERLVRCFDDGISAYYGLLDGVIGSVEEGIADTGAETTGVADTGPSTITATTMTPTTDPTDAQDPTETDPTNAEDPTETDPTDPSGGIEYPEECEDLMPGPFEAIDHGQVVETEDASPPLGSEDLVMDGNGGVVMRSGTSLRRFLL